jgi:YD repeat-containing protein
MHYDSNGNVLLLTNAQGQETARYSYDAFGKTLTATGIAATLNRYRFSTKPVEIAR